LIWLENFSAVWLPDVVAAGEHKTQNNFAYQKGSYDGNAKEKDFKKILFSKS